MSAESWIEVNPEESGVSDICHHVVRRTSAQVLQALVAAAQG